MTVRALSVVAVFVLLAGCAAPSPTAPAAAAAAAVDVVELSAAEARDRMAAGTLTSRALTEAYLARIAAVDKAGPTLNAVIEVNPQALADADRLDAERAAGKLRGPLHGVPVLLKDNIDAVGMVNSAGSLALADHRPATDAFLVTRLRDAGAVILGKTNLSEWANFRSTRSSSGWSSRGGQTRHAYVLDRNPCGSSAGTGTAMTASLAALGVGTETDGSILCPAAVSGLVGLKPTVGVVSRSGIIPISVSQDTAGPMTRTVTDAALLLSAIAAADPGDPAGRGVARRAAGRFHRRPEGRGAGRQDVSACCARRWAITPASTRRWTTALADAARRPAPRPSTSACRATTTGTTPSSRCCSTSSRTG